MKTVLKQFVPSSVCLQCDGCCRFKDEKSPWRPRLGKVDVNELALQLTDSSVDDRAYLNTIQECGRHFCQFFRSSDSSCRVYEQRPFECSLYPFILSKVEGKVKVYVHLACPYVQDHQDKQVDEYGAYLRELLNQTATQEFLTRNQDLFHDYTSFEIELKYLFDIEGLIL